MTRRPAQPAPHPMPPRSMADRVLPLVTRPGPWWRIHRENFSPIFFGRTGLSRFDHPQGRFGVLYLAAEPDGAFIETFGWQTGEMCLSTQTLGTRRLAQVWSARAMNLVDLTGPGLAQLGADVRATSGPHRTSQRWSAALHDHPSRPDGLLYRARHDPAELCIALFERAGAPILAGDRGRLADPCNLDLLGRLLDKYKFGLVD